MDLLGESDGSIIVRELTGCCGACGSESNTVVDVQETSVTARRPDGSSCLNQVLFGVNITSDPLLAGDAGFSCALVFISNVSKL
jgi:hypothetical protein